jgi:hypothetical protein
VNRRIRILAITVAASLTAAVPGTALAATGSGTGTLAAAPAPPHLLRLHAAPGESPAAAIADAVARVAQTRFKSVYVGEVLTNNGNNVVMYLTQLSRSAETAISSGMQAGVVKFARAPRSLSYLNGLHQRVTRAQAELKRQGTNIVTWGPDFITGRENVTVQNLDAAKKAQLDHLFGAASLTFSSTTRSYTAVAVARDDDTPPWNGGDYVIMLNSAGDVYGECTSGFPVHKGSTDYLLTAGHCAGDGYTVVNGDPSLTGSVYYEMGTISTTGNFGDNDGVDAELIDTAGFGGSSEALYTGSSMSPSVSDVSGTASSPAGDQVCDDGAFEGEICDLVIQSTTPMPECITEAEGGVDFSVCDVYQADNPSGGIAVGNGDSGGPVFRFSGSNLEATGIITAEAEPLTKCPTEQYPALSTRECSPILFYTSISSVLSEFGVTLNT